VVAEKEAVAAKNRQKRKDKDAMIAQLTKATAENEAQLAELQVCFSDIKEMGYETRRMRERRRTIS
jgi:16S rRNA G1207 methylase RsmC